MYRNNRPVDPAFLPEEDLYIRFNAMEGQRVDPLCIRCPDQSVNRSKYSEPEWVLLDSYPKFVGWGYGAFKVRDVPENIDSGGGVVYEFSVDHDPLDDNYSHSEVRAYRDGERTSKKNKPILIKFRLQISRKIRIDRVPQTSV